MQVRAKVHTIGGSANANQAELLKWHRKTGKTSRTFFVQGNKEIMQEIARHLKPKEVVMPKLYQAYKLTYIDQSDR